MKGPNIFSLPTDRRCGRLGDERQRAGAALLGEAEDAVSELTQLLRVQKQVPVRLHTHHLLKLAAQLQRDAARPGENVQHTPLVTRLYRRGGGGGGVVRELCCIQG